MTRIALTLAVLMALALPANAQDKAVAGKSPVQHRLVIHVDDNNPQKMNLALNNAANVSKYYASKGEDVAIEIVAYGPGLHMLRADSSPVKTRIASFQKGMPNVAFSACGNTIRAMTRKSGKKVTLLNDIKVVPAGVTRIMELQEKGWSYLKP